MFTHLWFTQFTLGNLFRHIASSVHGAAIKGSTPDDVGRPLGSHRWFALTSWPFPGKHTSVEYVSN
jgi:hypothetical protein